MLDKENVKKYLFDKHLHASQEWIEECIEWNKSENAVLTQSDLNQAVYEQWLFADLRSMEIGCLPENLASFKKITIEGKKALQVEFIKDVSESAYSQMQEIRKVIRTTNEEFLDNDYKRVKPKRMLHLHMCDGVQDIIGMEYHPIPKLNPFLSPGIKVLIKGPIECRRGVLMLKDENIEIIGGEIEDLLIKNSYENILARALNLPERTTPSTFQQNDNQQLNQLNTQLIEIINNEHINQKNLDKSNNQPNNNKSNFDQKIQIQNNKIDFDDDDFLFNDDLEDILNEQIEENEVIVPKKENLSTQGSKNDFKQIGNIKSNKEIITQTNNQKTKILNKKLVNVPKITEFFTKTSQQPEKICQDNKIDIKQKFQHQNTKIDTIDLLDDDDDYLLEKALEKSEIQEQQNNKEKLNQTVLNNAPTTSKQFYQDLKLENTNNETEFKNTILNEDENEFSFDFMDDNFDTICTISNPKIKSIKEILEKREDFLDKSLKIHGKLNKSIDKLRFSNNNKWLLKASLVDKLSGDFELDVEFSHEVLEKIIGLNAQIIQMAKNFNFSARDKLQEAVREAKIKLFDKFSIYELKFSLNINDFPKVIGFEEI